MTSIEVTKMGVNREDWLNAAVEQFRPRFEETGYPLPDKLYVSVGFGTGVKGENKVILGATWLAEVSEDGVNHIYVSPIVSDTAEVLRILLHECIHAALDCQDGHTGRFAEIATRLGFTGSMQTTPCSPSLAAELMVMGEELGKYPHGRLQVEKYRSEVKVGPDGKPAPKAHSGPKTQTTRYLKMTCPDWDHEDKRLNGYSVRLTAKWAELGHPSCPCGQPLEWS